MVTKPDPNKYHNNDCLILAKNHMVTKPIYVDLVEPRPSYSSKKSYGNKTRP